MPTRRLITPIRCLPVAVARRCTFKCAELLFTMCGNGCPWSALCKMAALSIGKARVSAEAACCLPQTQRLVSTLDLLSAETELKNANF